MTETLTETFRPAPAGKQAPAGISSVDAALLLACAEYARLAAEERRLLLVMRSYDANDESPEAKAAEEAWDKSGDDADAVLERVVKMQATTPAGAAAKGRSVLIYIRTLDGPNDTDATRNYTDIAARSVLTDLERMAGEVRA